MPIKEFIPMGDVKQTTEKAVKPRRTVKEVTTIDTPGTIPKEQLEAQETEKKKRAPKAKPKTLPEEIKKPKRDAILIITEKPQAAQKIASALGTPLKFSEKSVSFYEVEHNNQKIIVASAVGHLYGLDYVKGQKGYPIFKLEWRPAYEKKNSAFTKRYLDLLKDLSKRAKEFMVATDFDIEGEVIGWNVLRFICKQETAKRMKFSTLTKDELVNSFEHPLETPHWGNAYAGETRHILDWLYGINLSRALMSAIKKTGSFKILSIGRVQGPALKVIVDREREILAFKPVPFWEVYALSNNAEFKHPKDIFDKKELDKFKKIKEAQAKTSKTQTLTPPPNPFDLTTLQREAYRWCRTNPSETLKIAQKLYLDGLISYPRTSSQKIPDSIQPKAILKHLSSNFKETKLATRANPVEGAKSDPAHPSIFPTGEYAELTGKDKQIYELIVKRFISCFSPDAETESTHVTLTAKEKDAEDKPITFTASGLKISNKGWTAVYPSSMEESTVPELNGLVKIDKINFLDKETQPPKRYSQASLITVLEKKNLGTKATRASIVDTLFERGYIEGTSIKATPLGMQLISTLEKYSSIIIDEELTRQIEVETEKLQDSNEPKILEQQEKKIVARAEKIITDISKEFKEKEEKIGKEILTAIVDLRKEEQEANTLINCPICKEGKLRIIYSRKTKRHFIACSAYPNCKQTYSLPPNGYMKKSEKTCESCGFPMIISLRKGKKPWIFCFNKDCEIVKKQRADWEAKQLAKQNTSSAETQTDSQDKLEINKE